jgi:hypothetical protein
MPAIVSATFRYRSEIQITVRRFFSVGGTPFRDATEVPPIRELQITPKWGQI